MYDPIVILPPETTEFGIFCVVAEPDAFGTTPDYCGSETLLGWDSRTGWSLSWATCQYHNEDSCRNSHPIAPEAIQDAANGLEDDDYLERWLNICAPDGIGYRVSKAHGYSQGDVFLLVESYPTTVNPESLPDPEHNEAVNWARGDVFVLVIQRYNEDSDTWTSVHNGYPVYGPSWALPNMDDVTYYAEECLGDHLSNLELERRAKAKRDADLSSTEDSLNRRRDLITASSGLIDAEDVDHGTTDSEYVRGQVELIIEATRTESEVMADEPQSGDLFDRVKTAILDPTETNLTEACRQPILCS